MEKYQISEVPMVETKISEMFRDDSVLLRDSAKTGEPKLHRISPFSRETRVIVGNER